MYDWLNYPFFVSIPNSKDGIILYKVYDWMSDATLDMKNTLPSSVQWNIEIFIFIVGTNYAMAMSSF